MNRGSLQASKEKREEKCKVGWESRQKMKDQDGVLSHQPSCSQKRYE